MAPLRRQARLLAFATLVACGGTAGRGAALPTTSPSPPAPPAAATPTVPPGVAAVRLWLALSGPNNTVEIVEPATSRTVATFAGGALSPDWSHMYSVSPDQGSGTELRVEDPRTGALLDRLPLPSGLDIPESFAGGSDNGLSPSGRRLVLVGGAHDSAGTALTSEFRVYDTVNLHAGTHAVSLSGSYFFAGIDNAGHTLYLDKPVPQPAGSTEELRRYDLVRDRLDPNPITPREGNQPGGDGGASDTVVTANGSWQLSVHPFGSGGPYLDALDLDGGALYRIALPMSHSAGSSTGGENELLWSVVLSTDGRHAYAVNPAEGAVLDITPAPPFHVRGGNLPTPSPSPSAASWWQGLLGAGAEVAEAKRLLIGGATLSPDGRTLYAVGDNGVDVIDTATLRLRTTWAGDTPLQSMSLSPDGRWLYAASATPTGGLLQIDTQSGATVSLFRYIDVLGVLRVTPAD